MSFIEHVYWAVLYALMLTIPILSVMEGYKWRKRIGPVSDTSFKTYWRCVAEPTDTVLDDFTQTVIYPGWLLWIAILGQPEGEPPPPPPPGRLAFDFEGIVAGIALDLRVRLPNVSDNLIQAFAQFLREELPKNHPPPPADAPEEQVTAWNAKVVRLTPLLKELGVPIHHFLKDARLSVLESDFTTSLPNYVPLALIDQLFYNLSVHELMPETYSNYSTGRSWGNFLTHDNRKLELAKQHEHGSIEHVRYNLARFPVLRDACFDIGIPPERRFEGTWVVAPQGRGKTTLLSALLKGDLKLAKEGNASIVIFDSKGDLIEHVRQLKTFAPGGGLAGKLTLIEPSADLAINPLDLGVTTAHTISLLEYVFSALLESKNTPLQSTLFRSILIALKAIPNATFATFRDFLVDGWKPYAGYLEALDREDAEFFTKGEFDSPTYKSTRQELLWRIRDLTTKVPLLREMFRSPTTKINLGKLMDAGGVIIIDNSVAQLTNEGSTFFGRFFVALILAAAQQRAGRKAEDKMPVYVYLDEAQTVIANDPTVATIIQTCRSQKIAMTFAHQELMQIKSEDVRSALGNCAVRFANPDKDAYALADDFRTDATALQGIPKGSFAMFVRDEIKKAMIVDVANNPVWTWPKMTDDELATIRARMKELYSVSRDALNVKAMTRRAENDDDPDNPDTSPQKWG